MEKNTHTHTAIIEPLQRKHMEQVILLLQNISVYLPPKYSYDDIWESFINQPNIHSVVATENEEVVGYGAVVIETKIRGGKMGHIEDIVSHPNKRNMDIGKMVVNALYEIAKTKQCYKVSLQCQQHNILFYEKCEYKVSGTAMQRFIQ
jgi:glucosamine-phosphate N-acetyltransferase